MELMVVTAIVAVLTAIILPTLAAAREKANQTKCQNNQRQLLLAIAMYQHDHEGKFPDKMTIWQDLNLPPASLVCPTSGEKAGTITYGYNAWISGKTMAATGMPKANQLPVIADSSTEDHLLLTAADVDYRHYAKATTAFADGHVAALESAPISVVVDHELFSEQVQTWPSGYKAFYNLPYPSGYSYFNSLAIDPIPGWESNDYDDITNMCGMFGVGVGGDQELWVRGMPYGYWKTKPVEEVYLRIPLPENADTIGDDGVWAAVLPSYDYVNMGASMDFKTATPPQMKGYAQVSILDGQYRPIATLELRLAGTSATYTINGVTITALDNVAELTNSAWEEDPAKGGWTPIRAWNYKYANASAWWKHDFLHSALFIGKGDGHITCGLACPSAPEVGGTVTADALPGADVQNPRWIEFRVSDVGEGHPGEGTVRVLTQKYGGGILWGISE